MYKRDLPLVEEFQYFDMFRFFSFMPSQRPLPIRFPRNAVRAFVAMGSLESVSRYIDVGIVEKTQQVACAVSVFVFQTDHDVHASGRVHL